MISFQKVRSNPGSDNRGSKLEPQSWSKILCVAERRVAA